MDQHFASIYPGLDSYGLPQSPLVVVIDDEVPLTKLLAATLEDEGYVVQVAYDGPCGLNLIKRLQPDLIISDIMLPLMSGIEIVHQIQNNAELADIPIILMSAGLRPSLTMNEWQLENVEFLAKPFDLDEFLDLVNEKLDLDNRAA